MVLRVLLLLVILPGSSCSVSMLFKTLDDCGMLSDVLL